MRLLFALGILLIFSACKKPEDRKCFKKSGMYEEIAIHLGDFDRLALKEHIRYTLIQDSTDQIVIKGGSNLINFINVVPENGLVSISNKNKCNYLRKYEVVDVEIHFTKLINILFEGTEDLNTIDTLKTDYLSLTLRDGGGSMKMCIHAHDVNVINTHGWADLSLTGVTNTTRLVLMGDGSFNTIGLKTMDSLSILSASSTIQRISADGIPLKAQIDGIGNIEYYGNPSVLFFSKYGKGDLIHKN